MTDWPEVLNYLICYCTVSITYDLAGCSKMVRIVARGTSRDTSRVLRRRGKRSNTIPPLALLRRVSMIRSSASESNVSRYYIKI